MGGSACPRRSMPACVTQDPLPEAFDPFWNYIGTNRRNVYLMFSFVFPKVVDCSTTGVGVCLPASPGFACLPPLGPPSR